MFENDDLKKARKTPALVWAIIAGLISFGIIVNVTPKDPAMSYIVGAAVGFTTYFFVKSGKI